MLPAGVMTDPPYLGNIERLTSSSTASEGNRKTTLKPASISWPTGMRLSISSGSATDSFGLLHQDKDESTPLQECAYGKTDLNDHLSRNWGPLPQTPPVAADDRNRLTGVYRTDDRNRCWLAGLRLLQLRCRPRSRGKGCFPRKSTTGTNTTEQRICTPCVAVTKHQQRMSLSRIY